MKGLQGVYQDVLTAFSQISQGNGFKTNLGNRVYRELFFPDEMGGNPLLESGPYVCIPLNFDVATVPGEGTVEFPIPFEIYGFVARKGDLGTPLEQSGAWGIIGLVDDLVRVILTENGNGSRTLGSSRIHTVTPPGLIISSGINDGFPWDDCIVRFTATVHLGQGDF